MAFSGWRCAPPLMPSVRRREVTRGNDFLVRRWRELRLR